MMSADAAAERRPAAPAARAADPIAALCESLPLAQQVTAHLARQGFEPLQLSIVGDGTGLASARGLDDRVRAWGGRGGIWGALGGLAVGALLVVPPVGSVIAMGPIVTLLISALEGAMLGGGLSAIVAALTGIGLPLEAAQRAEDAMMARRFLVFVHGDDADVARARKVVAAMGLAGVQLA